MFPKTRLNSLLLSCHLPMLLFTGMLGLAGIITFSQYGHEVVISSALADDTLSREVGQNLQQAQSSLAAHSYSKALAAVNTADAVKGKSDYETYVILQMRAAIATASGNTSAALKAYDLLIKSHRTSKAARGQMLMAQASLAYGARDYATAAQAAARYLKEIGPSAQIQTLMIQSHYLRQDWKGTVEAIRAVLAADSKAGITPQESHLQMLATACGNLHDENGQTDAYVQLVKYFPRTQYWQILIHNLASDQSMPQRLIFNVQRLRLATGALTNPEDFQSMGERAVQIGLPQLALNLIDAGYSRHILGTGPEANRQAHFRAFVAQQAAQVKASLPDAVQAAQKNNSAGPALTAGYNLVLNGQIEQGLALLREGLTRNPRYPDIARLEYGMALMDSGRLTDAIKAFNAVTGNDTVYNLAQLWTVYLSRSQQKPSHH